MKGPAAMTFVLAALTTSAAAAEDDVHFEVAEGGHANVFHQSRGTAWHFRVTNPDNPRLVFAFPAENSGIALSFDPSLEANRGLAWRVLAARPWFDGPLAGAAVELEADRGAVVLTQALLDSMRMIRTSQYRLEAARVEMRRDLAHLLSLEPEGWVEPVVSRGEGRLAFERRSLSGERYRCEVRFEGRLEARDGAWEIRGESGLRVTVRAAITHAPLTPIPEAELLSPAARKLRDQCALVARDPRVAPEERERARQLVEATLARRWSSYREKTLAGSPRFNTYFGRDTILSTLLAGPMLTHGAREAALHSVLDRLSPEGIVAHEEDVGGMAEHRRVEEALRLSRAGKRDEARAVLARRGPIHDYKMVDGDFLLPLLARECLLEGTSLDRARREGLARNLVRVVATAAPWGRGLRELEAAHPGLGMDDLERLPGFRALAGRLVAFRHGTVGDWRDSIEGTGLGRISAGVNAHLVPHALAAVAALVEGPLEDLRGRLEEELLAHGYRGDVASLAAAWREARRHFEVRLSGAEARRRIEAHLATFPEAERALLLERLEVPDAVRFTGIALDDELRPIPVLQSDVAFDLLFGDLSHDEVRRTLEPLRSFFPLGLRTEAGTLVASPALSDRPQDRTLFERGSYHGAVVWGWQESLVAVGLARQVARLGAPGAAGVRADARALLEAAIHARARAGALANGELWTFAARGGRLEAVPFKCRPGTTSESNPVQLWSAVGPGERLTLQMLGR